MRGRYRTVTISYRNGGMKMYKFYNIIENLIGEMIKEYSISAKSEAFYKGRIRNFFNIYMSTENNKNRPLNTITYFDIDTYLSKVECGEADRLNIYNALKRFFEYSYRIGETKDVMYDVTRPLVSKEPMTYVADGDYKLLKDFIYNIEKDIKERLIIGVFLFTGLGRMHVYNIRIDDFVYQCGVYKLKVWKANEEIILPLKAELQLLIQKYLELNKDVNVAIKRIVPVGENELSSYVKRITKRVTNTEYTPTNLSSTFIKEALKSGNYIWEISNLTLESIGTIEKHISFENNLELKQLSILNSF